MPVGLSFAMQQLVVSSCALAPLVVALTSFDTHACFDQLGRRMQQILDLGAENVVDLNN